MGATKHDPPAGPTSTLSEEASWDTLKRFRFTRLLNEDTQSISITLLGTYSRAHDGVGEDVPAILTIQRQPFSLQDSFLRTFVQHNLGKVRNLLNNDIYSLFLGWSGSQNAQRDGTSEVPADLKITLTQPATEVHIRKASAQTYKMVRETPELYESIVRPYIQSFPPDRLQWVYNILSHKTESENIIYEDPDPESGFIVLPDLKWDQTTLSTLYLQCIVHTRSITCIRDLNTSHIPMLRNIRKHATRAAKEKYGVQDGELRMFVHYQPSFYHFHVHIVHISSHGYAGARIGQAHLLDTIIDNLELELADSQQEQSERGVRVLPQKSYYARRTLTYGLGEQPVGCY